MLTPKIKQIDQKMSLWELTQISKCGTCEITENCWTSQQYEDPSFCVPKGIDPNNHYRHYISLPEGQLIFLTLMFISLGFCIGLLVCIVFRFCRVRCRSPFRPRNGQPDMPGVRRTGTLRELTERFSIRRFGRGDPPV